MGEALHVAYKRYKIKRKLAFSRELKTSEFRGTGEKGIYFRGTGKQRPNFEGNMGTKTILGNREHKKTKFRFFGEQGNKPIYFRGTREQIPPWRASEIFPT